MNETATRIEQDGSAVPGVQTEGTTSAGIESTSEQLKPCPHRYAGCISQNGYMCTLGGPCAPCDEHGRHFTVKYVVVKGQQVCCKTLISPLGLEAFRYRKSCEGIIDVDAALASTPFADTEPFDPAKFVSDVIGS